MIIIIIIITVIIIHESVLRKTTRRRSSDARNYTAAVRDEIHAIYVFSGEHKAGNAYQTALS